VSELSLSSDDGRIREWVAQAHERTAVEAIESPPGFVADCDAAPGALAFASTAEAAIEEMRSVLLGWASLRVERGHDLPVLPAALEVGFRVPRPEPGGEPGAAGTGGWTSGRQAADRVVDTAAHPCGGSL